MELLSFDDDFACYGNNKREVGFIYKEIFQLRSYDVINLPEHAFVIDAGANIGLFSIWVKRKHPSCKILAFEPAPDTFQSLQKNLALHQLTDTVTAIQCGLGSRDDTMSLTYYPDMPGSSTLFPEEKEQLRKVAMEEFKSVEFDEMFINSTDIQIPIKRLSSFLDEQPHLRNIDLLKLDVEGSEIDVLRGLSDKYWDMTQNIVMEVFDVDGRLDEAKALLRSKGFSVNSTMAEWSPKRLRFYMVTGQKHQE